MGLLRDGIVSPHFEMGTALISLNHPLPFYTLLGRSTYKESKLKNVFMTCLTKMVTFKSLFVV